jgi:hypothetical protein
LLFLADIYRYDLRVPENQRLIACPLVWAKLTQLSVLHAVLQLVEALRNKPEGGAFDSRMCH